MQPKRNPGILARLWDEGMISAADIWKGPRSTIPYQARISHFLRKICRIRSSAGDIAQLLLIDGVIPGPPQVPELLQVKEKKLHTLRTIETKTACIETLYRTIQDVYETNGQVGSLRVYFCRIPKKGEVGDKAPIIWNGASLTDSDIDDLLNIGSILYHYATDVILAETRKKQGRTWIDVEAKPLAIVFHPREESGYGTKIPHLHLLFAFWQKEEAHAE